MKRYYRKNRSSVALFLVSNLLAAGSSVFMSFLLGTFADSAMEGDLSRVWKIALVTLFYLCIETFYTFLLDYSRDIVVQRVGRDLRADAVRKRRAHGDENEIERVADVGEDTGRSGEIARRRREERPAQLRQTAL